MGISKVLGFVFHSIFGKSAVAYNNGANTQTRVGLLRRQAEVIR
ncbi:MAG: hypothetical protein ABF651_03835 [Sporolactobacillus sp.]